MGRVEARWSRRERAGRRAGGARASAHPWATLASASSASSSTPRRSAAAERAHASIPTVTEAEAACKRGSEAGRGGPRRRDSRLGCALRAGSSFIRADGTRGKAGVAWGVVVAAHAFRRGRCNAARAHATHESTSLSIAIGSSSSIPVVRGFDLWCARNSSPTTPPSRSRSPTCEHIEITGMSRRVLSLRPRNEARIEKTRQGNPPRAGSMRYLILRAEAARDAEKSLEPREAMLRFSLGLREREAHHAHGGVVLL